MADACARANPHARWKSSRPSWTTSPNTAHHLHPPIVGVGPHGGDPHYEPVAGKDSVINNGDYVLVDLWAKMDRPGSVYRTSRASATWREGARRLHEGVQHRRRRARRGHRLRARRLQGGQAGLRLAGGRRGARVIEKAATASTSCTAPATASPRGARQRRQHGQPGDARRAAHPQAHVLFGRARDSISPNSACASKSTCSSTATASPRHRRHSERSAAHSCEILGEVRHARCAGL